MKKALFGKFGSVFAPLDLIIGLEIPLKNDFDHHETAWLFTEHGFNQVATWAKNWTTMDVF